MTPDERAAAVEQERRLGMPRWNLSNHPDTLLCPKCRVPVLHYAEHLIPGARWTCERAA